MAFFSQIKQQLSEQLSQLTATQGVIQLQASLPLANANLSLLSWLKVQKNSYPHFYLAHRDKDQTIITLGCVKKFEQLKQAQAFVNQTHFPLVGGLPFESGEPHECDFLLPRLMLVKTSENLTAYGYLDLDNEDIQAVDFNDFFANSDNQTTHCVNDTKQLSTQAACSFTHWQQNIEKAIQQIKSGDFSKVVLANATTLTLEKAISAYDLLDASQKINLGCYHFLWAEKAESVFIGSTPERLYHRQGQCFYTEALAGTVAVTDDPIETERNAQWLRHNEKNIHENQLVVDDITSHLQDVVTQFQIGEVEIKRLHNVQHLRRQIQAELNPDVSDEDCLARIHPTAAVAGLPRPKAIAFILENEPFKRHWYAGTLGIFNPNEAEFCVALRSALVEANQITLYAGAGIVLESEAQSEWQEIERKSQALAKLLVKQI